MSAARHTPGPWIAGRDLVMAGSSTVAHVFAGGDRVPGQKRAETRRANARLIAAAPDLLHALEEIAYAPHAVTEADCANIAKAAIAKATGKETA